LLVKDQNITNTMFFGLRFLRFIYDKNFQKSKFRSKIEPFSRFSSLRKKSKKNQKKNQKFQKFRTKMQM